MSTGQYDNLPPNDRNAERAALGSILLADEKPNFQRAMVDRLVPADFYLVDYGIVFRVIKEMLDDGERVDSVTIMIRLRAQGKLTALVGGKDLITDLFANAPPDWTNGIAYVDAVVELSRQRQLLAQADLLRDAIMTHDGAKESEAIERMGEITLRQKAQCGPVTDTTFVDSPPAQSPVLLDRICRMGELICLAAPPKSLKTQLAVQMGLSVATGRPLLETWAVANRGAVFYANGEVAQATFENRVSELAKLAGIASANLKGQWSAWHTRENPGDLFQICDWVERAKIKDLRLLVIDPIRSFYPAFVAGESFNENSNAHMAVLVRRLLRLTQRTGTAVVVVHHASKGSMAGKAVSDQGAGAGALAGGVDVHAALLPHREPNCFVLTTIARSLPSLAPIVLESVWPAHVVRPDLDPGDVAGSKRRPNKLDVLPTPKPAPWTPERFADKFATDEWKAKDEILLNAKLSGVSHRDAECCFRVAIGRNLIEGRLPEGDRKRPTHFRRAGKKSHTQSPHTPLPGGKPQAGQVGTRARKAVS